MSNILSKINKKRGFGNGINISKEKVFLKYVRETMLDFDDALNNGSTSVSDIAISLKNILSSKRLNLENIMELIPLIEEGKKGSPTTSKQVNMDIQEEHEYMEHILSKHFIWTEHMGMYSISYRNKEVA